MILTKTITTSGNVVATKHKILAYRIVLQEDEEEQYFDRIAVTVQHFVDQASVDSDSPLPSCIRNIENTETYDGTPDWVKAALLSIL